MGQNSLNYGGGMNDNRINPIPRESLGQISDRSAVDRGDFTVPNVAGGNSDPGHPTGANFSLSQGIQLPVSDGLTQPPTIQNSPFQCSNGELIKRMVDRESVRFTEHVVKTIRGGHPHILSTEISK